MDGVTASAPRRVGIFGGTFDPVHIGHLIAAEEARMAVGLAEVLFVPARRPPHKLDEPISKTLHRVRMLELALEGNSGMAVSRVDVDREGPHYTVDMLARVGAQLGPEAELYFLMGSDSLIDLPNWREPERIVQLAVPVVVDRPGYQVDLDALERRVPGLRHRLVQVHMPLVGISSSSIERRVIEGRPIRYQVPDSVEGYIRTHGLYSDAAQYAPAGPGREPPDSTHAA